MGDGTANVGLGVLDTAGVDLDRRDLLRRWCDRLPPEYGYTPEAVTEPIRGSALPMGLNREPHYADGLLLVGDAGGTVSPGAGEGIAYAMESGRFAAETAVQALARRTDRGRELALRAYPQALRSAYAGYFALGRLAADLLGRPRLLGAAGAAGLGNPALLKVVFQLMVNLTERTPRTPSTGCSTWSSGSPPAGDSAGAGRRRRPGEGGVQSGGPVDPPALTPPDSNSRRRGRRWRARLPRAAGELPVRIDR
ncbi:hypothetical protein P3T27_005874 [Kitasatospora sp. MAA19]|uniref:hypothetical protein n=1 Tax=unclassified Kitasatospora TaxID=2633591 RepID=UPI0024737ACC|nr:hypothetical protein [Kitasatospora sp. MAA19]MDH6709128.1 hypothetical protein [Kitasatospora sp. MAA19]